MSRWRSGLFTVAIGLMSRGLMARDSVLGVVRGLREHEAREEFSFFSGDRQLAAVFVAAAEGGPVVLICHGIGETVGHWSAAQAYLRDRGIGSMVFNYSGYGASSGRIDADSCEEDVVSAYRELRRRVGAGARVFVLGFSLGSGVAANGVGSLMPPPAGLFLCGAFTSFREAARAVGFPGCLIRVVPDIWDSVKAMRGIHLPVCVVHSDSDRLFPVAMARRIADSAGRWGELVVVSGLAHNELYLRPADDSWGPIVERMLAAPDTRRSLSG